MQLKKYPITDIQMAYYIGREKNMFLGGNSAHGYLEYEGNADPAKIETALNTIIKKYDALRLIINDDGTQSVLENIPKYKIEVTDLTDMDSMKKELIINDYRKEHSAKIYKAGTYPLFGFHAFKIENLKWRYAFDVDLMIMDRSSIEIFFKELEEYYFNDDVAISETDYNFIDYVQERNQFKKNCKDDELYWKNYIESGKLTVPKNIEENDDIGNASSLHFVSKECYISSDKWNEIKNNLTERRIIPSVFVMTAYAKALSTWQNSDNATVNMTTSLRNINGKSYSKCIGDFTELVITDVAVSKDKDLYENALETQRILKSHMKHSALGGIKVMNYLAENSGSEKIGICPFAFTSSIEGKTSYMRRNVLGKNVYQISQTPQLKIDCQIYEEDEKLIIRFDYPQGIFKDSIVEEILMYMKKSILVEDLSYFYKQQFEYNSTFAEVPKSTIQAEFRKAVENYPKNIALICEGRYVTYSELDKLSDKFAFYIENKVGTGQRVALDASRTIETVAVIIGILKTGGSYIPLEPKWPKERKEYIISCSESKLYINDTSCCEYECDDKYQIKGDFLDEAYIIFTSGSTGKPKGVMISQQSVYNTLLDINERFEITEKDVIAGISSFCFDLSVYDMFGAFISGAALALSTDMQKIADMVIDTNATVWNTVPAIMELFLNELGNRKCSLKTIMLSGDWIPLNLKNRITERIADARVYSLGGATEASIWSIYYPIDKIEKSWKSIPYGYPLKNQTMWILNTNDEICPIGVAGEICIGGEGVALGYVADSRKTDEQFFVHERLGRLYRTGDYGIFHNEGYIEFIGRHDFQIKVHGYRIELGEIENAINKDENIKKSVVTVTETENAAQHILAYAIPNNIEETFDVEKYYKIIENDCCKACDETNSEITPEEYNYISLAFDEAAKKIIRNIFVQWGYLSTPEKIVSAEDIIKNGFADEKYYKLMKQWISVMENEGYLYTDAVGIKRCVNAISLTPFEEIVEELKSIKNVGKFEGFRDFMILTSEKMTSILKSQESPLTILFPNGGWERAENLYRYSPSAQYLNNIAAEAVAAYIKSVGMTKNKIRILEVGAGVGGTTAAILEKISKNTSVEIEYHYTDLSEFFTEKAKKKFADYSFVNYGCYSLDLHPEMQGYKAGSFDIIIGANSVHDSSYLRRSLGYLRILLKNDGMLCLLELTRNLVQHKTTIGLIDGFSGYEDERKEKNEILLSVEEWKQYMEKTHFSEFMSFPVSGHKAELFNHHIMLAFANKQQAEINETEILKKISNVLPEYMMPEHIYTMNEIPLSSNGKVDRSKLPIPDYLHHNNNNVIIIPENEMQKIILEIFEAALNINNLSTDTNIFKVGADSLKAITITAELEKKGMKITLSELYKYSDVLSLEDFILNNDRLIEYTAPVYNRKSCTDIYKPFKLTDQQQSYAYGRIQNSLGVDMLPTGGYIELSCQNLDILKLENALNKIIDRHEIFRCVFNEDGTGQFLKNVPYRHIPLIDLRHYDESYLNEYMIETRKRIMSLKPDIKKPPVMYAEASRISDTEYIIHLYLDGLMLDGWSVELFIAEFGHIYKTGEYLCDNCSDVTFIDYVEYLENKKNTEKYNKDKQYWKEKIDTLPDAATLPILKDIKELGKETGTQNKCGISESCWNKLSERAAYYGVSMFSVLITSFAYVIGKWNYKKRFLLNIPEFNRPPLGDDIDKVMGVYSSFLLYTSDIDIEESFIKNVKKAQQEIIELKEHNSFTGMEIVREISRRSEEYSTDVLVPIVFGMMPDAPNYNENYLEIEKSVFKIKYQENHTSLVWIDINVLKRNGHIDFNWCSVKGLFDEDMIRDMILMQEEILNNAAESNDFWEKSLKLTLPHHDRLIINNSNDTDKPLEYCCFAEILRKQFCDFAEKELICDMEKSYTYAEVEKYIKNIANRFKKFGVSQGDKVAIYTEKGIAQIIYILATVYIGAVFVPIEYSYPANTVLSCLNQTGCKLMVVSEEKIKDFSDLSIPVIDDNYTDIEAFSDIIEYVPSDEDSLIYIMHTSGSTGVPKAVEIYQKALLNCVVFTADYCNLTSDDKAIALTNAAHDLSVYDIFGLIYVGGSIAVPNETDTRDPQKWAELISKRQVTFWNTVPAMQEMLMEYLPREQAELIASLKTIILGGDYVKAALAKKIFEIIPNVNIISIGGPTETTIWNIMHTVTDADLENELIPYGKPISNNKYHILGENLEELPIGVVGMMYCSGIQLAKGYCGNHEETEKKFFYHPAIGERIYKTGDMGMYAQNGEIIFMGRCDNQVKIHGKRIELGGINSFIGRIDGITRSAVITDGNKILAFYSGDGNITPLKIKEYLKTQLPDYMIPDIITEVSEIPLKSNGKTDNEKLLRDFNQKAANNEESSDNINDHVENELLEKVNSMFKEVLGCEIDYEDDFFEAGGDSLTAITLLNKIREISPNYSIRDFYRDHCSANVVETLNNMIQK